MLKLLFLILNLAVITLVACGEEKISLSAKADNLIQKWKALEVTASAYNSLEGQGSGNVNITAWGDTLKPDMQVVAVSRDLVRKGLTYGTPVKIEGLEGVFIVRDKMNSRWKNKIDIYMGTDRDKALQWGRKKLQICFPDAEQLETWKKFSKN